MDHQTSPIRRSLIPCLIMVHVVAGIVSDWVSEPAGPMIWKHYFSLIICQASLIGIWGGLGLADWKLRWVGVVVSPFLLAYLLDNEIGGWDLHVFLVMATTVGSISLVTWCWRLAGAQVRRVDPNTTSAREGRQFTIRQLLMLTLVVACLLMLDKLLTSNAPIKSILLICAVTSLYSTAIAIGSLWAVLGLGSPMIRVFLVLATSAALGWGAGRWFGDTNYDYFADLVVHRLQVSERQYFAFVILLQAEYLLASLAVVRFSGFRLVSSHQSEPSGNPPPEKDP